MITPSASRSVSEALSECADPRPLVVREGGFGGPSKPRLLDRVRQAISAVLGVELPWLDEVVRAKRPHHLPVVLTRDEVRAVLERLRRRAEVSG